MLINVNKQDKLIKFQNNHVDINLVRLVNIRMKTKMDYEKDLELCEYNPISLQYEKELRMLAAMIETPAMNFFQRLMKKIVCANGTV